MSGASDDSYSDSCNSNPRPRSSRIIDSILDTSQARKIPLRPVTPPPSLTSAYICIEQPARLIHPPPPPPTPHSCPLKERCIDGIACEVYHRTRAAYLIAAANERRWESDEPLVNIQELDGEGRDLVKVKLAGYDARSWLEFYWIVEDDVLRGIQSPEYWEAERSYLNDSGCLYKRRSNNAAAGKSSGPDRAVVAGNGVVPTNGPGPVVRISNPRSDEDSSASRVGRKRKRQKGEDKDAAPPVRKRTRAKLSLFFQKKRDAQRVAAASMQENSEKSGKAGKKGTHLRQGEGPWMSTRSRAKENE